MRRRIVITDLTRMHGDRVCLAGYPVEGDDAQACVRPTLRYGQIVEPWLLSGREAVVRPFAVVELDLLEHRPHPPHAEDWVVDGRYRVRRGMLAPEERVEFLAALDDGSVGGIFGTPVHEERGWFVRAGEGERSLGTVRPEGVVNVTFAFRPERGRWEYRLAFGDADGRVYNLAVTDLAFRYFLDHLCDEQRLTPGQAGRRLLTALQGAERLYLRVGLARGGHHPDRCYLQINGVYSFPDYLDGRCFADLVPASRYEVDLSNVPF